eukprot:9345442-Lingulodinium_polyedra.AAC.1
MATLPRWSAACSRAAGSAAASTGGPARPPGVATPRVAVSIAGSEVGPPPGSPWCRPAAGAGLCTA